MTMTDPISDMLTRIRNGLQVKKEIVSCPSSGIKLSILEVLKKEGYIRSYKKNLTNVKKPIIEIELKYYEGSPAIKEIVRISKPGMRVYTPEKDMPSIRNKMGISIISTSQGVMTNQSARNANLGGEVICRIF